MPKPKLSFKGKWIECIDNPPPTDNIYLVAIYSNFQPEKNLYIGAIAKYEKGNWITTDNKYLDEKFHVRYYADFPNPPDLLGRKQLRKANTTVVDEKED